MPNIDVTNGYPINTSEVFTPLPEHAHLFYQMDFIRKRGEADSWYHIGYRLNQIREYLVTRRSNSPEHSLQRANSHYARAVALAQQFFAVDNERRREYGIAFEQQEALTVYYLFEKYVLSILNSNGSGGEVAYSEITSKTLAYMQAKLHDGQDQIVQRRAARVDTESGVIIHNPPVNVIVTVNGMFTFTEEPFDMVHGFIGKLMITEGRHCLVAFNKPIVNEVESDPRINVPEGLHLIWITNSAITPLEEGGLNLSQRHCSDCGSQLTPDNLVYQNADVLWCKTCYKRCPVCTRYRHNTKSEFKKTMWYEYHASTDFGRSPLMELDIRDLRRINIEGHKREEKVCAVCRLERISKNRCGHPTKRQNSHRTRSHGNQCTRCYVDNFDRCGHCGNTYLKEFVSDRRCRRCALQQQPHIVPVQFRDSTSFERLPTKRHFAVELEVEKGDWSCLDRMPGEFQWKVDLSLDPETGIEFNTPIANGDLGYDYLEKWHKLAVEEAGFKVSNRCGLHVHVNVGDYNTTEVTNILRQYAVFEDLFNAMISRDRVNGRWCNKYPFPKEYWAANIPQNRSNLIDHIISRCGSSRYWGLNTAAIERFGSLEFRHHEGSVDLQAIKNWVYLCTLFVEKAAKMDIFIVPPKVFRDLLFMFWSAFDVPVHIRRYMLDRIREHNKEMLSSKAHRRTGAIHKKRKEISDYAKAVVPVKEYSKFKLEKEKKIQALSKKLHPKYGKASYTNRLGVYYDFSLYTMPNSELLELYEQNNIEKDCPCSQCVWGREAIRLRFRPSDISAQIRTNVAKRVKEESDRAIEKAKSAKQELLSKKKSTKINGGNTQGISIPTATPTRITITGMTEDSVPVEFPTNWYFHRNGENE